MSSPHRNRSLARRLALQALYQQQLNPRSWQDTRRQFAGDPEAERVAREYFEGLVAAIAPNGEALDLEIAKYSEIAPGELDPIEHAVLWLGLHELASHPELPYRVPPPPTPGLPQRIGAAPRPKTPEPG